MLNLFKNLFQSKPQISEGVGLIKKLDKSNERVLDCYESFNVSFSPTPLILVDQDYLKFTSDLNDILLGLHVHNTESRYIDGMYFSLMDGIFIDDNYCKVSTEQDLDKTLSHEYGHKLYNLFMRAMDERYEFKRNNNVKALLKGRKKIDPIEYLAEIFSKPIEPKTETEIRRMEFETYFQEMFVDSIARYLIGMHEDEEWFDSSESRKGEVFYKDREFVGKFERLLHKQFFDNLFQLGLKRTVIRMPIIYQISRNLFELRYRKQLEPHRVTYL